MSNTDVFDAIATTPAHELRTAIANACKANSVIRDVLAGHLLIPCVTDSKTCSRKRKAFEICVDCKKGFEVLENKEGDCKYHEGAMELDWDSSTWDDYDDDAHGDRYLRESDPDFKGGFAWGCCDRPMDDAGCIITSHTAPGDGEKKVKRMCRGQGSCSDHRHTILGEEDESASEGEDKGIPRKRTMMSMGG